MRGPPEEEGELFAERSPSGVSLRDIAAADVNLGLIHRYVGPDRTPSPSPSIATPGWFAMWWVAEPPRPTPGT